MTRTDEPYEIRHARRGDADAAAELWALMAKQHRHYDAEAWCWADDARQTWRERFLQGVDEENMVTLVAEAPDGSLAGYTIGDVKESLDVFSTARTGFVWDLVVCPAHRGRGLGVRLMEAAFARMKALGAEDVILHVALKNLPAVKVYEKLGMRRVMYRMYKRF